MEIESNRELAIRIKGIAETMMHLEDFVAARNFALKAQKLYANLENISEMLMICEVHCAADHKLFGCEMDWYGILQVEETADEATIEQRYMKFASVLHPGTNTYPGAEAAYKIIKQAKTVLLSKHEQSSLHCADMECKDQPVASHGSQGIITGSGNSGYQDTHKSHGVDPSQLQKVQDAATTLATPPATNSMSAAASCREDDSDEDGIDTTIDNSDDVLLRDLRKCNNVNGWKKRKVRASEDNDLGRSENTIKRSRRKLSGSADEVEDQEEATEALGNGSQQRHSEADLNARSVSITELNKSPVCYEYADSEFNDFDKDRKEGCFSKGQIWAVYADPDTMPRYYAHIRNVSSSRFSLQITWLEPVPDNKKKRHWIDKSFPAVCGLFKHGESVCAEQRTLFSHLVHWEQGSCKKSFKIFPRTGETWALFKNWNTVHKSAKRKHKYEIVEILSEYNEINGVRVAPLHKVNGFVSIFSQSADDTLSTFRILPGHLSRFSHKLPSFKMSGKEREGLPAGCFEIDPASLPESICPPQLSF